MPILLAELKADPLLEKRLFEVDFLATLSGEMLVTLIYHRKLDNEWEKAARTLAEKLNIKIIGRSRGQKLVLTDDFVVEELQVLEQNLNINRLKVVLLSLMQLSARKCLNGHVKLLRHHKSIF